MGNFTVFRGLLKQRPRLSGGAFRVRKKVGSAQLGVRGRSLDLFNRRRDGGLGLGQA